MPTTVGPFAPRAGGAPRSDSVPDGRTVGAATAHALGEVGSGTLRGRSTCRDPQRWSLAGRRSVCEIRLERRVAWRGRFAVDALRHDDLDWSAVVTRATRRQALLGTTSSCEIETSVGSGGGCGRDHVVAERFDEGHPRHPRNGIMSGDDTVARCHADGLSDRAGRHRQLDACRSDTLSALRDTGDVAGPEWIPTGRGWACQLVPACGGRVVADVTRLRGCADRAWT